MVKIVHYCINCTKELKLKTQLKKLEKNSKKNKVLIDKIIKCKHCNYQYKIEIIEGYSNIIDVVFDNDQTIIFNSDHLLKVQYCIGEYDRGVQDEIYFTKQLENEFIEIKRKELEKKLLIIKDGNKAENKFRNYLNKKNHHFLFIHQDKETFPKSFNNKIKRPDFLIFDSANGHKYIDVKNYTLFCKKSFRMYIEEYKKLLAFKNISKEKVFFAYVEKNDFSQWYFIDINKVKKLYKKLSDDEKNKDFFYIDKQDFDIEL